EKDKTKKKATKKSKKKKKNKLKKKWNKVILIILILLVLAVGTSFVVTTLMQPKDVTVPDLTELEYEEAVNALEKTNLQSEREFIFSEEIEEDFVVKTSTRAGRTVKENSTVTIYVSDGKEKIALDRKSTRLHSSH